VFGFVFFYTFIFKLFTTKILKMKILNLYFLTLIIFLFWGCNNNKNGENSNESLNIVNENQYEDIDSDILLPSALQIISIFNKSGLTYVNDITNPTTNITYYNTKLKKSLNFGIYSADLCYTVTNNQSQEAIKYLNVIKQLLEELGMSNFFNSDATFKNFEQNIGNQDSMVHTLSIMQKNTDKYLAETNQQYLNSIYFVGAWIEGMYLGSKIIKSNNDVLTIRLIEQMYILNYLLHELNNYPDKNDEYKNLVKDLTEIKDMYNNFQFIKNADNLDELNYEDIKVTTEEVTKLSSKIEAIRNKITNK